MLLGFAGSVPPKWVFAGVLATLLMASKAQAGTASTCGVATYCGGQVISNVHIVPIYWTGNVRPAVTSAAPDYIRQLVDSPYMDLLSEYSTKGKAGEVCERPDGYYFGPISAASTGQTITRGTSEAPITITPIVATGSVVDDSDNHGNGDVTKELKAQLAAGKIPAPVYDALGYANTLYVVFFPQDISVKAAGVSCTNFHGYHSVMLYTPEQSCAHPDVAYAVIPDCYPDVSVVEQSVAHEVAEAVTDPDMSLSPSGGYGGWYLGPANSCVTNPSQCPTSCGEMADVCETLRPQTIPGTTIQALPVWSPVQNGCAISNPSIPPQTAPQAGGCGAPVVDAGTGAEADSGTPHADAGSPRKSADDAGKVSGSSPPSGSGTEPASADQGSGSAGSGGGCAVASSRDGSVDAAAGVLFGLTLLGAARGRRRRG